VFATPSGAADHGCLLGSAANCFPVIGRFYLVSEQISTRRNCMKHNKRAFTLIELLVVVLIIGILAAIALPQYQKAVDKSRVATILPLMRRWADAFALYKLEHGTYSDSVVSAESVGASWPSDWECPSTDLECWNELWYCFANEEGTGYVYCDSLWKANGENFKIMITQPNEDAGYPIGKRFCNGNASFCKSLGGKEIAGYDGYYEF
jgi:prepilin-type N-terminal cleavage/methylation domain-containing protein